MDKLLRSPLHTARATATEWTRHGKINMLFAVNANNEGRNIHNLLPHAADHHQQTASMLRSLPNVALKDQHACMVYGFRQSLLKDQCLQASLQEILWSQC